MIEVHAPTLIYSLVFVPALAVILITVRSRHPPPLDLEAKVVGITFVAMALLMTWMLLSLRTSLRNGVAAAAEILDATRTAGHLRVQINGHMVDRAYRSITFARLTTGDRITVLMDPRKESVLLTLGRAAPYWPSGSAN